MTCAGTSVKAGALATAMGGSTNATGRYATAMGSKSKATGFVATAMGGGSTASGLAATAMGANTIASGDQATAMGSSTVAHCGGNKGNGACVAMGNSITNNEQEALAVSGNVHAKNVKLFGADARLAANATDADPAALLANVERLRVVERVPSENYCKHQGCDPVACASDRAVGLLAQQVGTVIPHAVGSGAALTLVDAAAAAAAKFVVDRNSTDPRALLLPVLEEVDAAQGLDVHRAAEDHPVRARARASLPVLEEVDAVQGIDVHALLAQLVGSVQALSQQLHDTKKQYAAELASLRDELRRVRKQL